MLPQHPRGCICETAGASRDRLNPPALLPGVAAQPSWFSSGVGGEVMFRLERSTDSNKGDFIHDPFMSHLPYWDAFGKPRYTSLDGHLAVSLRSGYGSCSPLGIAEAFASELRIIDAEFRATFNRHVIVIQNGNLARKNRGSTGQHLDSSLSELRTPIDAPLKLI